MNKFVAEIEWLWGNVTKKQFNTAKEREEFCADMIDDYRRIDLSEECVVDRLYDRVCDFSELEWDLYL